MYGMSPQAYDRAITVFSPDGRLFQVEYAKEAVKRGATSVGIVAKDGVVIAALKSISSPLIVTDSVKKIFEVDKKIFLTASGLIADARKLVKFSRQEAQRHRLLYGEDPPVHSVATYVADIMQLYTQYGGARPFGVSLLIAGVDSDGPKLFEAEPSGALTGYLADSIGEGKKDADAYLEKKYNQNIKTEKAIELAVKTLNEVSEEKPTPDSLEIAYVKVNQEKYTNMSKKEIEKLISKI